MSLRRFAQTNHASVATETPTKAARGTNLFSSPASASPAPSPVRASAGAQMNGDAAPRLLPTTPRQKPRFSFAQSPTLTPSISASVPFDWDAARGLKPAPYASPVARAKKVGAKVAAAGGATKRFVRKKGLVERLRAIPSRIAFEIALFPNNVPRPSATTSALLIGGGMHLLHMGARISQGRTVEYGWEDVLMEHRNEPWVDWSTVISATLLLSSTFNALYLFSRLRLYQLHRQPDPVASPSARFVPAPLDSDFTPFQPPPLATRLLRGSWRAFVTTIRFLLNLSPSSAPGAQRGGVRKVQQLEVWEPGQLESRLFCVYSPVHALLWMATTWSNWIMLSFVMGITGVQLWCLTHWYEQLVKDRNIIHAEVMHEYNTGFVYPRINPIRCDASVMTHESEMVDN